MQEMKVLRPPRNTATADSVPVFVSSIDIPRGINPNEQQAIIS